MATTTITKTKTTEETEETEKKNVKRFLQAPYKDLDFLIYRFVHPTDKRGLPYPELPNGGGLPGKKVWVGDFAPQWGEFLLDLGEPVYDVQNHQPLVTRMEGFGLDQGRVKYRNLQTLAFPWGIDGSLPVQLYANQIFKDNNKLPFNPKGLSRLDLQHEARRRKLRTHGKRSDLIKRINDHELKVGVQASTDARDEALNRLDAVSLPLFRVLETQYPIPYSPWHPLKQPPFETGEIVLVYGTLFEDENICLVRDYEGNRGRISRDYLEEIEIPFGLKLNRRQLVEVLERLGWPDEEDPDPEPEDDSPEALAAAKEREEAARAGGWTSAMEKIAIERAKWKKARKAKRKKRHGDDYVSSTDEEEEEAAADAAALKQEEAAKQKLKLAEEKRKRKAEEELRRKNEGKQPRL